MSLYYKAIFLGEGSLFVLVLIWVSSTVNKLFLYFFNFQEKSFKKRVHMYLFPHLELLFILSHDKYYSAIIYDDLISRRCNVAQLMKNYWQS